jgi:cytochrome c
MKTLSEKSRAPRGAGRSDFVRTFTLCWGALVLPGATLHSAPSTGFDVLVFSRTAGFRHDSIPDGIGALTELGAEHGFEVVATEDPEAFTDENLGRFAAVVFLSTTGDVLAPAQEQAFQRYIEGGGGYVGIHAASDTEYEWPWYGELVGAYFSSHPAVQNATIKVADPADPSTRNLPRRWERRDEWYSFRRNPRGKVHVLATLDESTYEAGGGRMGHDHPIAWRHRVGEGRAWYTAGGHTRESYSEPLFREHILGGVLFAAGAVPADAGATVDALYAKTILDDDVTDPMALAVADDGRVFFVERAGTVKAFGGLGGGTQVIGEIPVHTANEDGLLGIALAPDFSESQEIYLFYSPAGDEPIQRVSRFALTAGLLDPASEQVILTIPTQRDECCHSGGGLAFGPDGSLFIGTGDNTNPFASDGYAPLDERPGREAWDAQRTAGNANDLRGKILRIRPGPDGGYSIPEGNLFPPDGSAGRPEIFVMGCRNPFRFSVDPDTGWLYWGDVGPDGSLDYPTRGPRGYDEWNQARRAGNFGWPYFIADNKPYRDFDFDTEQAGGFFDPAAPVNDSPNNTGPAALPPAQPAMAWYPYGQPPEQFPDLSVGGGRCAMAGPVIPRDRVSGEGGLPPYFAGALIMYDWTRDWIREARFDEDGNLLEINPFLGALEFRRPIDMALGPRGELHVLEWGSGFAGGNDNARLVRVNYLGGQAGPALRIRLEGGEAQLRWRDPAAVWALETLTGDLTTGSWAPANGGVVQEGVERVFSQPAAPQAVYFRLRFEEAGEGAGSPD